MLHILTYDQFIKRRIKYTEELFGLVQCKDLYAQTERREQGLIVLQKITERHKRQCSLFKIDRQGYIRVYPSGITDSYGYLRLVYLKPE